MIAAHKNRTIVTGAKKGFGLIEVVISAMLFVLVWLVLAGNIMVGKASEVGSRHHIQAAYYAQSYVEQVLRQQTFSDLIAMRSTNPNQSNVVVGAENALTQFNAIRRTTINSIVSNGTAPMYANVTVDIEWNEPPSIGRGTVQHEYVMTIIPNDPISN